MKILFSLKLARKDLVLDHQIGKTSSKPLICTGEVSHHTRLNLLEQQYASRTWTTGLRPPILGVRRSKQDTAQELVLQPPSIGTTKMPPTGHAHNNKRSYEYALFSLHNDQFLVW